MTEINKAAEERMEVTPMDVEDRRERLSSKQVAAAYEINESTLRSWRFRRAYDKRYPRYHKLFTGAVSYYRDEFEEDLANMEIDIDAMPANL